MNKRFSKFIRISCFCLIFCLVIAGIDPINNVAIAKEKEAGYTNIGEAIISTEYVLISENKYLKMLADKTGRFYIENKITGKKWYSTAPNAEEDEITGGSLRTQFMSELVIEYIFKEDELVSQSPKIANSFSECVSEDTVTVNKTKSGMKVIYDFKLLGIKIPVIYELLENRLDVSVDFEKLVVDKSIYLMSIQLLPAFGGNNSNSDGYLFVPDGCGALIDFDNNIDSDGYEAMVYGKELAIQVKKQTTQTENIYMPVFGINTENNSLLAIITDGDMSASIVAHNRNSECGYDTVSSKRIIRSLTQKIIYENDAANKQTIGRVTEADASCGYAVSYYFLSNENSGYVGMAKTYRDYLINNKGLESRVSEPTLQIDFYGLIDYKTSFLGIPYTSTKELTTYSQAQVILKTMQKKGIDRISARYLGWTNDGLLNIKLPQKAKAKASLGGKKNLEKLYSFSRENNISLSLDLDVINYRKGSGKYSTKTVFDQNLQIYHYLRSVYSKDKRMEPVRLLSLKYFENSVNKLIKSNSILSKTEISLGDVGEKLYSNLAKNKFLSRSKSGEYVISAVRKLSDQDRKISVNGGNAYLLPYINRLYNVPTSSSRYDLFTDDVPFYQIVLHGFITMSGDSVLQSTEPIDNFLKAVETGNAVSYSAIYESSDILTGTRYENLYSSTYSLWLDNAVEQYKNYMPLLNEIYNKEISEHQILSDDVYSTTFGNGIRVIVNYSNKKVKIGDITIGKKNFEIIKGEK